MPVIYTKPKRQRLPRNRWLPSLAPGVLTASISDGIIFSEAFAIAWIINDGVDGIVFGDSDSELRVEGGDTVIGITDITNVIGIT